MAQVVRRLPFGLPDKLDEKLQGWLTKDIEEVLNSPTEWVFLLEVVPKSNGDVRVCRLICVRQMKR